MGPGGSNIGLGLDSRLPNRVSVGRGDPPFNWRIPESIAAARGGVSRQGDSSYYARHEGMVRNPRGVCRTGHLPGKIVGNVIPLNIKLVLKRYPRADIAGAANGIHRERSIMALRSSIFAQLLLACMMRFAPRIAQAAPPTAPVLRRRSK